MNILIYKVNDYEIVEKLVQKEDASLYLAISEEDIFRIAKDIKPDFMIIDNQSNLADGTILKIIKQNPGLHIYILEDNKTEFNELILMNQIQMKKVNFNKILN
jgi:hypothetical protein